MKGREGIITELLTAPASMFGLVKTETSIALGSFGFLFGKLSKNILDS